MSNYKFKIGDFVKERDGIPSPFSLGQKGVIIHIDNNWAWFKNDGMYSGELAKLDDLELLETQQ